MIVYYVCSQFCDNDSIETKLAIELQKADFDMWSMSIPLEADTHSVTDNNDDNFGNTNIAIFVVSTDYLNSKEIVDDLQKVLAYKTIKLLFVLNSVNKNLFIDTLDRKILDFRKFVDDDYIFVLSGRIEILASKICKKIFVLNDKNSERVKTGITTLDYLLGGGLIAGSALNIIGPRGSGTTSLGIQIQKNMLESGRSCLYITYGLSPIKILNRFKEMGCDITKYINNGNFRIFDSFSALNGLTIEHTKLSVGDKWFPAIIRVEDPSDTQAYFEQQIQAIKSMGVGGINVIDATNERYNISKEQKESTGEETYKIHFSRFKAMAGDTLQNIGIHLVRADSEVEKDLIKHLTRTEDGDICLLFRNDDLGNTNKYLKVNSSGQYGIGDTKEYGYKVGKDGFKFLGSIYESNIGG